MFIVELKVNDKVVARERVVNVSEQNGLVYGDGLQLYENWDYHEEQVGHVAKAGVRKLAIKVLRKAIENGRD